MRCPLLFAAAAFVAGTLLAYFLDISVTFSALALAICAFLAIVLRLRKRGAISTIFALISVFFFAVLNLSARKHSPCALENFAETLPEQVELIGKVRSEPQMVGAPAESGERTRAFTVAVYDVCEPANLHSKEKPLGNVLTYWRPGPRSLEVHSGDTVQFFCKLYPLRRAANPGERDWRKLSRGRGICARAYIGFRDEVKVIERGAVFSFSRAISAVRGRFRNVIERSFGERREAAAFLSAILIGDRTSLSQEKENLYFNTGTVHILSISGLHVGILAFFLFYVLRWIGVRQRPRALTIALVVILYSFVGGLSIPLVRTTIIVLLYIAAEFLPRQRNVLNILSAAAITMLLINPYDLLSVGFQLTFIGCLSLALFATPIDQLLDKLRPRRRKLLERLRREPRYVPGFARAWLSVSIAAWIGVQPLVTYYFHIFTPLSIVINTLIVPCVLIIALSLGFFLVILGSITIICATVISYPLGWLLWAFDWLLEWFTMLGIWFFLPNRFLPAVTLPALIGIYAALALLALKLKNVVRLKTVHIVTAFAAAFTLFLGIGLLTGESGETEFTVLDVGNGSAFVLREGGKTVLFDCGSTSRIRAGEEVIASFLWKRGEDTIDAVFLSHSDTDHTNGLDALTDRFRIGCVFVSEYFDSNEQGEKILDKLEARGIRVIRLEPRAKVERIAGEFEVLAPVAGELFGKKLSPNNSSLVVSASICGKSFLLCGDIEEAGIFMLLETVSDLSSDVLQLPHHGRGNPLLSKFVRAVNPEILFVSIARDKPYLFETGAGSEPEQTKLGLLSTAKSGAITFRVRGEKICVEQFARRGKTGSIDTSSLSGKIAPQEKK